MKASVIRGDGRILAGIITFKDKLHIAVTKQFLGNLASTAKVDILAGLNLQLKEYMVNRKIGEPIITIHDTPAQVVIALMGSAHKWQPDFLGFWNISFDVNKMLEVLKDARIDPAQVFSDPSVPAEYKYFNWREDSPFKITSSGKRTPKHPADRWHVLSAPASFYCICLMSLFKTVRAREQQRSTYKLDSVLKEFIGIGKLRFAYLPDNITDLDWHKAMQTNHKLDYLIYMAIDAIGPEMLDEKTNDASRSLRATTGLSEISKAKSNPKRLGDDMHFDLLADNKVIGSTCKDMTTTLDAATPNITGWIITLASELEHTMGRCLITEYPLLETNITTHAFDVDVKSAYPSAQIVLNISKTTRHFELCKIDNLTTSQTREIGINLSNVDANALSLAQSCYNFPSLDTLLDNFKKEITS